jgi:hypothetical protein
MSTTANDQNSAVSIRRRHPSMGHLSGSVNPTRIDLSDARRLIAQSGLTIVAERDLNHGQEVQLRTAEGPILSVYNTKKYVLGGTRQELLQFARDDDDPPLAARGAERTGNGERRGAKPPRATCPGGGIEQTKSPPNAKGGKIDLA